MTHFTSKSSKCCSSLICARHSRPSSKVSTLTCTSECGLLSTMQLQELPQDKLMNSSELEERSISSLSSCQTSACTTKPWQALTGGQELEQAEEGQLFIHNTFLLICFSCAENKMRSLEKKCYVNWSCTETSILKTFQFSIFSFSAALIRKIILILRYLYCCKLNRNLCFECNYKVSKPRHFSFTQEY